MTILAQKTFLFELRDRRRVAELAEANDRLEHLARTDPLTGIANRRSMTETLDHLWSGGRKCPGGAAMLMCDIDDFKKLNDRLGHAEGDRCLVQVAALFGTMSGAMRDHVARYGGEEFLVLLPGADEQEAIIVAERIRESVEAAAFPNPASRVSRLVTLSIGVAVKAKGERGHLTGAASAPSGCGTLSCQANRPKPSAAPQSGVVQAKTDPVDPVILPRSPPKHLLP